VTADGFSKAAPDVVDVVALGESMVTFLPTRPGRLADVPSFERAIGGAESNVLCALAATGHTTRWVSRVGADGFGDHLLETIVAHGVDVTSVRRDPSRPTGVYFRTAADRATDAHEVAYYRSGSAASAMTTTNTDLPAARAARVLHLSGITAALSPSCLSLLRALTAPHPDRPLISFDVNHRPGLWPHKDAPQVLLDLARRADLVFVGEDEAQEAWGITGGPRAIRAALPEPTTLVVKQGAQGATLFERPTLPPHPAPAAHEPHTNEPTPATKAAQAPAAGRSRTGESAQVSGAAGAPVAGRWRTDGSAQATVAAQASAAGGARMDGSAQVSGAAGAPVAGRSRTGGQAQASGGAQAPVAGGARMDESAQVSGAAGASAAGQWRTDGQAQVTVAAQALAAGGARTDVRGCVGGCPPAAVGASTGPASRETDSAPFRGRTPPGAPPTHPHPVGEHSHPVGEHSHPVGERPHPVGERPRPAPEAADTTTFVPSPHVTVVSPIGAGDAFAAGFLSATLRGLPPKARLRHAHLMAAAALTTPGDLGPPPTRHHADHLAALDDDTWGTLRLAPGWAQTPDGADEEVRTT
jgi:sugar/nucleoside kinase (ribokinase family)